MVGPSSEEDCCYLAAEGGMTGRTGAPSPAGQESIRRKGKKTDGEAGAQLE